jgi:ADP-ribosylglycohydrolase
MPSSIYIILKYSNDFGAAARANAMVGGDNAARAVAIGMVLGAYHGVDAIPSELQQGLHAWESSLELLERLLAQKRLA